MQKEKNMHTTKNLKKSVLKGQKKCDKVQKKCYCPHMLRDLVSPVCGIFNNEKTVRGKKPFSLNPFVLGNLLTWQWCKYQWVQEKAKPM